MGLVPVLVIFGRVTLDFRESKCFLWEPETFVEMKEQLQKYLGILSITGKLMYLLIVHCPERLYRRSCKFVTVAPKTLTHH